MVAASDGRRRADFEVGDRSAAAFDRLYARLPGAEFYWTGAYGVYCLLPVARYAAEPFGAADRGLRQKRGDAGAFAGVSMWAVAAIIK